MALGLVSETDERVHAGNRQLVEERVAGQMWNESCVTTESVVSQSSIVWKCEVQRRRASSAKADAPCAGQLIARSPGEIEIRPKLSE